ncbi:hypothetical protein PoB_002828200 [Plakobranchus ocellatus]|uniref:Uncharacterized protein n=1 Tax=Plakobranchus ocellatus TaxID=259542 RepID=A0AAV4A369_9GAST|nr:hypothetical protein PoB_002828200 [Plakobranchus ocellatus]
MFEWRKSPMFVGDSASKYDPAHISQRTAIGERPFSQRSNVKGDRILEPPRLNSRYLTLRQCEGEAASKIMLHRFTARIQAWVPSSIMSVTSR